MEYSKKTLKYYENLKNIGGFDEKLDNVGTGIVGSPLCGDVVKLQLVFDENDRILDAKYKVFGCVSAIASIELVSTLLKGISIEEAKKIKNEDVAESLELTDIKRHCSVLVKEAIESAINNYLAKKNKENNQMITVSNDALLKLKGMILGQGEGCLGIGITGAPGGCSGIEYSLSYENEDSPNKKKVSINGVNFFYDPEFEAMINGVNIEIVENSFGQGFVVTNKNHAPCKNCSCRCSENDS